MRDKAQTPSVSLTRAKYPLAALDSVRQVVASINQLALGLNADCDGGAASNLRLRKVYHRTTD